jgi:hypothetical protein
MKVCNYKLDHCNGHTTCETLTSNQTVENPVTSTRLPVAYYNLKKLNAEQALSDRIC